MVVEISKELKKHLRIHGDCDDKSLENKFRSRLRSVCKPCWELKYCPYGPLVEEFPLLYLTRQDAIDTKKYYEECLKTGVLPNGAPLDEWRRQWFQHRVEEIDPTEYPVKHNKVEIEMSCQVFGHMCPVFFVSETITEKQELRKTGRNIPFGTRIRVARRDNYTCQECGIHLKDNEIEFDHIIPFSKGGSSEEHNLRLTCIKCNRRKGDKTT